MVWQDVLVKKDACREAVTYAAGFETFEAAWVACERGDWMLWWLAKTADRKRVVWLACQCARLALPHVKAVEERPRVAIETTEKWCRGKASIEDVRATTAYAAADANAAYATAAAGAYAAAAAAYANAAAYAAAYANAAAAAAYAADAARQQTLKQCADIVRAEFPTPPL